MALTLTGLKLQGALGRFGKTAVSDITSFVELPDGKVSKNKKEEIICTLLGYDI